jgi:drug/metabolite transporter (DMT)-like permease
MSATVATLPMPRALSDNGADTVRGIVLITITYAIMALGDVAVKFALPMTGLGAAILFRGLFGAGTVLAVASWDGRTGLARLRPRRLGPVLLRSLLQVAVGISWFAAWQSMTLADSYAVGFTTPLLATVFALVLIGERLDRRRIVATVLGFAGVLIMLRPGGDLWSPALGLLLAGVTCSAFARLMTRQLSTTETPECLAFSLLAAHIAAGAVMLIWLPIIDMTWIALAALVALGLCSGVSQMLVAKAYALAPVSALAPFDYSSMIWAVLLGWLVFGETPHLAAMQGAVVIAAAGLYSLYGEQRRHRRERTAA